METVREVLTESALRVLRARYLLRDERGETVESPGQLFSRVARGVAEAERAWGGDVERWADRFGSMMRSLLFLPNSPTLMNAGTPLGQLSACFVLPVEDSMEGIFGSLRDMALVQRTGGGTGFSFSRLRPKGSVVSSTGGEASGPVSFMRIFDTATENIKQGGKRRGANMAVLRVDHPDILEFIDVKRDSAALRNFNLSVAVTDAFMQAVEDDGGYALVDPRDGREVRRVQARHVFDAITDAAWSTGDPGLLFLDAIERANPLPDKGRIEATNPCGEIPLHPYEACTLGSVNLARLVQGGGFDEERLRETVRDAVRFLDDVVEINRLPTDELREATRATRKVGLGVMGFAEALLRLKVPYGSDRSVQIARDVMALINEEARKASVALARERGVFPDWEGSRYAKEGVRIRNATRTAIAPTGTIGIIAGTTPGIEPLFALAYRREHVLEDETLTEVNPLFEEALRERGIDVGPVAEHLRCRGTLDGAGVPRDLQDLFVTALEVPPERHLAIQAAFQEQTDNSVSKTINLPEDATAGDVAGAYREAWRRGLKGITVYRYGSRSAQVMVLGTGEAPEEAEHAPKCDPGECEM